MVEVIGNVPVAWGEGSHNCTVTKFKGTGVKGWVNPAKRLAACFAGRFDPVSMQQSLADGKGDKPKTAHK